MNNERAATKAETILMQLGGGRFLKMTGAKQLVDTGNGLQFKLPRGLSSTGIVCVSIEIGADDLYCVKAYTAKGVKTCIADRVVTGVYVDSLRNLFTQMTGLDTHL